MYLGSRHLFYLERFQEGEGIFTKEKGLDTGEQIVWVMETITFFFVFNDLMNVTCG